MIKKSKYKDVMKQLIPTINGEWDMLDTFMFAFYNVNFEYNGEIYQDAVIDFEGGYVQYNMRGKEEEITNTEGYSSIPVIKSVSFPIKAELDLSSPRIYSE